MNVLIACEESQEVCKAFRALGHFAFSCDIQPCSGGHPEWHILQDVRTVVTPTDYGNSYDIKSIDFMTEDFSMYSVPCWDLIIAHPPCTYLCIASACRLFHHGSLDFERYSKGLAAKEFFLFLLNAPAKYVCVENPQPLKIFDLPKSSCIVQPYEFGDPFCKKTYLWLKNLPPLLPTDILWDYDAWVSAGVRNRRRIGVSGSQKMRSRTFPGIAAAMASQWGVLI